MLDYVCRLGLEGIVSKRVDAPSEAGRARRGSSRRTRRARRCGGNVKRIGVSPAHGHQMHELGGIDVMHFDQTPGQSRHVACASSCMSMRACLSMRTSLEEGIKPHSFAGTFPECF